MNELLKGKKTPRVVAGGMAPFLMWKAAEMAPKLQEKQKKQRQCLQRGESAWFSMLAKL